VACTGLWLVEGEMPNSTVGSWGDTPWWSLTTLMMRVCRRGRRSQSMTPFAVGETIRVVGWTESTSKTWWSESIGGATGQHVVTQDHVN
jgi:hypothetical protein